MSEGIGWVGIRERTDVCEFAILEDEKVVFVGKLLELIDEVLVEVFYNINMCLSPAIY